MGVPCVCMCVCEWCVWPPGEGFSSVTNTRARPGSGQRLPGSLATQAAPGEESGQSGCSGVFISFLWFVSCFWGTCGTE